MHKTWFITALFLTFTHFVSSEVAATASPPVVTQKKSTQKIKRQLVGAPISPYVRKVILTLREKGLPYDLLETLPASLLRATHQPLPGALLKGLTNFEGKIPVLIEQEGDQEFAINDSRAIMDYLNNQESTNPLRPKCPKANARVDMLSIYGDEVLGKITHTLLVEKIVKPHVLKTPTDLAVVGECLENLPIVLDRLENILSDGRTWIADTAHLSLADITIISHLFTLQTSDEDLLNLIGPRKHLKRYVEKMLARPSFKSL